MKKRIIALILLLSISLFACNTNFENEVEKYTYTFFDAFDTITKIIIYEEDEAIANEYADFIETRLMELHKLYDKYNDYDGLNNIKTINDNGGIAPVKVSSELYDLIAQSIEWQNSISDKTDISMGALINVWSDYRKYNERLEAEEKKLPSEEELNAASSYTGIEHIILNKEESTVYIDNKNTKLDVGAVAKGYAVELVVAEVSDLGMTSGIIDAGGNIRAIGSPKDEKKNKWSLGIIMPTDIDLLIEGDSGEKFSDGIKYDKSELLETVFVNDMSIVTSGDYQRYFVVDGKLYSHLIDGETMYPGSHFRSVTVITKDSGFADFLSTALFLMPYSDGKQMVENIEGVEVIWLEHDGERHYSEGMNDIAASKGAVNK